MKKAISLLLALLMLSALAACEKIEPETGEGSEEELLERIAALEDELAQITGENEPTETEPAADGVGEMELDPSAEPVPDFAIPDDIGVTEEKQQPADYPDIVRAVLAKIDENGGSWAQDMNSGCLADFDGDGVNEMALLYSPDGLSVHILLARQLADGTTRCLEQYVCDLVGAAAAELWSGELAGASVLHIVYTNSDGDEKYGRDTVVSLADGDIHLIHTLTWDGNDFLNAHVNSVEGGETDDPDVFMDIYNSRAEQTITFPAGPIGVPLEALLEP